MNMGIDGSCKINFLILCIHELHVVEKGDDFVDRVYVAAYEEDWVYNLHLVAYAALKAAWHPAS